MTIMAKNKDLVRLNYNNLYLQFSKTGQRNRFTQLALPLNGTVNRAGVDLLFSSCSSSAPYSIETFANESLAEEGFEQIHRAVLRFQRLHAIRASLKGGIKWLLLPILLFMLYLGLNANLASNQGMYAPVNQASGINSPLTPIMPSDRPNQPTVNQQQKIKPEVLSEALQHVTKNDTNIVRLSSGHSQNLYVFADPNCVHCHNLEYELEKLKNDFNIIILPVWILGDDSLEKAGTVLCTKKENRASMWDTIIKGKIIDIPESCESGRTLASINTKVLVQKIGVDYTPLIIRHDGQLYDAKDSMDANTISKWAKEAGPKS